MTHRTEHAILEGLIDAKRGRVVLAMEMFTRDDQPALDRYLAGQIDEATFLAEAQEWANYHTGYRPLIESSRRAGVPVVGSNLSSALRRKLAFGGSEAFAALTDLERQGAAAELFPNSPDYWERFDRTLRGHMGGPGATDPEARLYSIQSLWDNTMGESCARALAAHPGHLVVHVNGGFHSWRGLGTAEQLRLRAPDAHVATVQIVPVGDLPAVDPESGEESADFVVYAETRARGLSEGTHAVIVGRELRYRLHVPDGKGPWPLLIWCPDEGAGAPDEAKRWELLIGDDAAIAVVEHPYPVIEEDLHASGRFSWDETFFEDLGAIGSGLARVRDAITRAHPIDRGRVLYAGIGAGGRVVATARWQDRDGPAALAIAPGPLGRLIEGGLSDPEELRGGELRVLATSANLESWESEIADRIEVGFPGRVVELAAGGDGVDAVRTALGLVSPEALEDPKILWIAHGSPLARQWAALAAAQLGGSWRVDVLSVGGVDLTDGLGAGSICLETDLAAESLADADLVLLLRPIFSAQDLASGVGIPLPSGPFGGTVVLVLPPGRSEDRSAAWHRLEEEDVTRKRSRFVGLRVAETGTVRDLPAVLDELRAEGKSVVRIAPVRFCATAEEMRTLRASTVGHDEGLRISWTPGLGGEIWRVLGESAGVR